MLLLFLFIIFFTHKRSPRHVQSPAIVVTPRRLKFKQEVWGGEEKGREKEGEKRGRRRKEKRGEEERN